jgi:hypothetical protein
VFENHYRRLSEENFVEMFEEMENRLRKIGEGIVGVASNVGQSMYSRKFASDFSKEMSRSVHRILEEWRSE